MNDINTKEFDRRPIEARRDANNALRRTWQSGTLILSAGILALGKAAKAHILDAVGAQEDFDDSDLWDDHSVGDVEVTVEGPDAAPSKLIVFFRASVQAAGGKATLTLSLADEWWAGRAPVAHQTGRPSNE